ncbi:MULTISPECIES: DUF3152 domain-containing protein [Streptomyces]|uniref:DUF3152 domain-containing protein n=1 Tax=Streptomyces coelicolor (strain ATCC BAA-471 / A3(2) / M145) TaxID=100226 RepID=Q9FBI6_STRCO|nr:MULTISPECIES: DUF3152 domain-containing protein [Streptomyces]MYU44696.1 DUF3152 domain-containing protein [Streptomyces sp. SID7813]MDX2926376.1 DUF3152 domain-containing protein [Streptomyces sp. NRRL_B-16638]NSL78128.1 DUF3152 domain-containing protein [Streptomyces coelicolor]QFI45069.1 DUF3152 domain-containing protein [Streptomyces coelicolor A3(2)]QKN68664.1 DUF3152 domain-containing protein [Streptomyces coelicolor]
MGRHSRRGPAPKADAADTAAARENRAGRPDPRRTNGPSQEPQGPYQPQGPHQSQRPHQPQGVEGAAPPGAAPGDVPGARQGYAGPSPGRGPGARLPDGETSAHGFPRTADGTPAGGVPGYPDGTPAHGVPRYPDGTPAHGVPRFSDGTPAHGVPRVRGGHPEQREPGGGWGEPAGRPGAGYGSVSGPRNGAPESFAPPSPSGPASAFPRQRQAPAEGPRQDYLDAFRADDDVFAVRPRGRIPGAARPADPYASVTDWSAEDGGASGGGGIPGGAEADADDEPPTGEPAPAKGAKGRTFTGIAAAAVTTVLAVVVAGQVADGSDGSDMRAQSATDQARGAHDPASRDDERPTPAASASAKPLTYEQKMGRTYPLGATLKASGKFDAVPGIAKGTGKGQKYTYRIDVEQGLGLDGGLFAEAVQKTLNDDRSWAHNGARTFERVESGQPDFVITLASPGTTAEWCAKSGLDTTEDNVSCDSAATQRVMINAYRWAQGAAPYGDAIHAYRQMLINHEVGHRIGYNHVTCDKDGELAPVMQQQTKFVDHDGIDCRPNAWAYPNG